MPESRSERDKVLSEAVKNGNIARTCRENGISRVTFYNWLNEYRISILLEDGAAGSEDDQTEDLVVSLACEHPQWGAASISWELMQRGRHISTSSVYRILRRKNLHTRERRVLSSDPFGFPFTLRELSSTFPGFALYAYEEGALYLAMDMFSGYAWCALKKEYKSAADFISKKVMSELGALGVSPLHIVALRGTECANEGFKAYAQEAGARYWIRKHPLEHPAQALFEGLGEYAKAQGECAMMIDIQAYAYNQRRTEDSSPYERLNFMSARDFANANC